MMWDECEQRGVLARAARKVSSRNGQGCRGATGKAASTGKSAASRRGSSGAEPGAIAGESVMLRGVPPNVQGNELRILAVMRMGGLCRADAERLLTRYPMPSMHAANMGRGMALVMVSEGDMAIIAGPGYRP